jgi:hypothetical protein
MLEIFGDTTPGREPTQPFLCPQPLGSPKIDREGGVG